MAHTAQPLETFKNLYNSIPGHLIKVLEEKVNFILNFDLLQNFVEPTKHTKQTKPYFGKVQFFVQSVVISITVGAAGTPHHYTRILVEISLKGILFCLLFPNANISVIPFQVPSSHLRR